MHNSSRSSATEKTICLHSRTSCHRPRSIHWLHTSIHFQSGTNRVSPFGRSARNQTQGAVPVWGTPRVDVAKATRSFLIRSLPTLDGRSKRPIGHEGEGRVERLSAPRRGPRLDHGSPVC